MANEWHWMFWRAVKGCFLTQLSQMLEDSPDYVRHLWHQILQILKELHKQDSWRKHSPSLRHSSTCDTRERALGLEVELDLLGC